MADPTELLHGTLDTLVLKTLAWGPRHGYAIARWLEGMGADVLKIEEGSLYPALYRLERRGWIEAEWGLSETKRRVKLYHLTDAGRERLAVETAQWSRFADTVARILHAPDGTPA
ncbi:transcriptional regulator, PadR-family (plasmid) [Gemmatirosa kalamazoonensis]|uniref:Transcriptional regulator, PadR-family n=1 Tax=Gemmatirosa kalamazoonensis TaxID=861299 RepID=W0RRL0_9BACT|nr:PadR family transcriptional regulator [Gemmatirosa kalamazoonensis]AHG93102.1 transcriptional regulator, PadR-family [Gemmatirosa kalamazoonensis]